MGSEIVFEQIQVGTETTRGTTATNPTDRLNMRGTVLPQLLVARPPAHVNLLAESAGSEVIREWATLSGEGPADTLKLPRILTYVMDGAVAAGSQQAATTAYLWTFPRKMDADNLKSFTCWWGDPSLTKMFKGLYGMADEWTIEDAVDSTDGAMMSLTGTTRKLDDVTNPTLAAAAIPPIIVGKNIQVWLDTTASAWGTTEITNRILGASLRVTTGVTYKYPGTGPTGSVTYTSTGRVKIMPVATFSFELNNDLAEWTKFKANVPYRLRVRHNGPIIEATHRHYVEYDIQGVLDEPGWGELENSNRSMELSISGDYVASQATDVTVKVMTTLATLP